MSKLIYDHLIFFEEIEIALSAHKLSSKEKAEMGQMIEETIHHRVVSVILTNLPKEHHDEFLKRFYEAPHDENLFNFLKEKVANIEELLKTEIDNLKKELLEDLKL